MKGMHSLQDELMIQGMMEEDSKVLQTFTSSTPIRSDVVFTTQRNEQKSVTIDEKSENESNIDGKMISKRSKNVSFSSQASLAAKRRVQFAQGTYRGADGFKDK